MTKTVSARISNEEHEQLRNRCNDLGCSVNDYIVGCLQHGLNGTSNMDLGSSGTENKNAGSLAKPEVRNAKDDKIPVVTLRL